jgi:hypothetical protein
MLVLAWNVAVDAFLWAKRVKGLSAKTLQHYEIVLKQFYQAHECHSPLSCAPYCLCCLASKSWRKEHNHCAPLVGVEVFLQLAAGGRAKARQPRRFRAS